jgi:hypothetical protein
MPAIAADSDYAKAVSNRGIILKSEKITLSAGSTVADALITSSVNFEANGAYLTSIGKLSEKAITDDSAWFYQVNDTFPDANFTDYVLSDGDKVTWHYSLNGGKDIGVR